MYKKTLSCAALLWLSTTIVVSANTQTQHTNTTPEQLYPTLLPKEALPELAQIGQYPVGVKTLKLVNKKQFNPSSQTLEDRKLTVEVWYPTNKTPTTTPKAVYRDETRLGLPFVLQGNATRNAEVVNLTGQPFPLVVLSHGYTGWIWDIGLTHRRGVGHVYSSRFMSDEQAEANLRRYIGSQADGLMVKKIHYESGHRERFWQNNCVAVGMAAGFVEPLEATAIMLIEISARYIAENLPVNDQIMPLTAKRFNQQMDYRWSRIVDFLKLHYMLTKRPEPYWQAHCNPETIPQSLQDDLNMWAYRGPTSKDFNGPNELFPAASYQYVLYGMEFTPDYSQHAHLYQQHTQASQILHRNVQLTQQMLNTLPPHRDYIEQWLTHSQQ